MNARKRGVIQFVIVLRRLAVSGNFIAVWECIAVY